MQSIEYFQSRARTLGTLVALGLGIATGPIVSAGIGSVVNVYFSAYLDTFHGRKYMPDLGNVIDVYPELLVLLAVGLFTDNKGNMPVKSILTLISGRVAPEVITKTIPIPNRCILLMHHRRHHHPGLTVQEFSDMIAFLPKNVPFKVVSGRGWGGKKDLVSRVLSVVEQRLYNAVDVQGCRAQADCHFRIYKEFLDTAGPMIVIVFPDKFGSQFYGDTRMFYRDGAFAAALAAKVPLVDTLSMYPTFAHQVHTAKVTRVVQPQSWWSDSMPQTLKEFNEFRTSHKKVIEHVRIKMQTLFLQDVAEEEAKIGSCDASVRVFQSNNGPQCFRCQYANGPHGVVCT
jgi:hypothetical protein